MQRTSLKQQALNKNLAYNIYEQWNNNPIYVVIDVPNRKTIYSGKSYSKASQTIKNF